MEGNRRILDGALPAELLSAPLSISQIWNILWARKVTIMIVTALCCAATVLYVLEFVPKSYTATATLYVSQRVDDPFTGSSSRNEFGQRQDQIDYHLSTQIQFLETPTVLLPVVNQFDLAQREQYMAGYEGGGSDDSRQRWAMQSLKKRISISQNRGSLLINVSVTELDPQLAADISNAIVEEYVADQKKRFFEPAKERADRYSVQLDSLSQKVDEAQAKVAEFRKKTGLSDLSSDGNRLGPEGARIDDLERRLTEASADRLAAELNLSRIRSGDATVLQSSDLVQSLRSRIQTSEARLAELSESLGSRHPEIVALRADLEESRALLSKEIQAHVEGGQAEVAAARSVESNVRAQLEAAKSKQLVARSQQDEAARLLRELETASKVYQGALDTFEAVRLGTQVSAFNVQIVSRAEPPLTSDSRRGSTLLVAAAILSGGAISILALLFELLNRRIRSREDMESALGIPVLVQFQRSI